MPVFPFRSPSPPSSVVEAPARRLGVRHGTSGLRGAPRRPGPLGCAGAFGRRGDSGAVRGAAPGKWHKGGRALGLGPAAQPDAARAPDALAAGGVPEPRQLSCPPSPQRPSPPPPPCCVYALAAREARPSHFESVPWPARGRGGGAATFFGGGAGGEFLRLFFLFLPFLFLLLLPLLFLCRPSLLWGRARTVLCACGNLSLVFCAASSRGGSQRCTTGSAINRGSRTFSHWKKEFASAQALFQFLLPLAFRRRGGVARGRGGGVGGGGGHFASLLVVRYCLRVAEDLEYSKCQRCTA